MRRTVIPVLGASLLAVSCNGSPPPSAEGTTTEAPTSDTTAPADTTDASGDSSTSADESTGGEPPSCGTDSPAALAACTSPETMELDVTFIDDIRDPGTPHWLAVQELCADRLTILGFEVELHEYATGVNVIGRLPGSTTPEEVVLVGAHYDHLGDCTGADDNASGVAGALETARVLSMVEHDRTLAIACWDQEELGLIGSTAWVEGGLAPGETVVTYFNYEMIGYVRHEPDTQEIPFGFDALFPTQYEQVSGNEFRGDFILMVADDLATAPAEAYAAHAAVVELPNVFLLLDADLKNADLLSDLRRSDHAPFWAADIPAVFLTDTANFRNAAYHCEIGEDTIDALDFDFSRRVVAATVGAAAETLAVAP